MAFTLKSSAFEHGGLIPSKFTCDGTDRSPVLTWIDPPTGTQSFALVVDDPDAPVGIWDHWILFNIPSNTRELLENIQSLPTGTEVGNNSWGRKKYNGPCPPDKIHRYFFKLYALDTLLSLKSGVNKTELTRAMQEHILGTAELMGRYERTTT